MSGIGLSRRLRSVLGRVSALRARWRCAWLRLSHAGVSIEPGAAIGAGLVLSVTDGASFVLRRGAVLGSGCHVKVTRGTLEIGENCFLGNGCTICAQESILIAPDVLIAERVTIRDQDHVIDGLGLIREQGMRTAPITIGRGAWIGAGAVILRGVAIGAGAVIGANAVVRSSIPDFAIAVGVPARVIRLRSPRSG